MAIKPIMVQRRLTEVGRIRIGQVVEGKKRDGGTYTRPAKLDTFRFTSISQPLIEKVAAEYGGTVGPWTPANGGAPGWEVITDTSRVPVLVPQQDVGERQFMEMWAGGLVKRRCDGETDFLTMQPCFCVAQDDMRCKPKTRLSVMLRDIDGLGTWRIESNGWGTAATLPATAEFLMKQGGYVSATLYLQPRSKVAEVNGKPQTQNWMVPALEVEGVTPGELNSGTVRAAIGSGEKQAVAGQEAPAIEAASLPDFAALIAAAPTRKDVVAIWEQAKAAGAPAAPVEAAAKARVAQLAQAQPAAQPAPAAAQTVKPSELWAEIVMTAGIKGFDRTEDIEHAFLSRYEGLTPPSATADQLSEFLADVQAGRVRPIADAESTDTEVPF